MSTLAQLFESGEQQAKAGHFRNLIMLARLEDGIDAGEQALLNRMARRLSLTDDQVKDILENGDNYPMIPPFTREDRYERFVRFVQMVLVDGSVSAAEKNLVIKCGVALGMDENKVEDQFNATIKMWLNGMDASEIIEELM